MWRVSSTLMQQEDRLISPLRVTATSLSIAALLVSACGRSSHDDRSAAAPTTGSPHDGCGERAEVLAPHEVTITGSADLLDAPEGEPIVNAKATAASKTTQYQTVDHTERLEESCRGNGWSRVRVLEPDWLTDEVGWVPTSKIRGIERDELGARQYSEADFYWDSGTSGRKEKIVRAVNRALHESPDCKRIDPGTLSTSVSRSRSGKMVYFVTCTKPYTYNIWFDINGETVQ